MICLICATSDTHRHSCTTCTNTTRRRLRETELYAAWLATTTMLTPTRGTTGRHTPGYSSRPPARDDVIVMLDRRSTAEDIGGLDDEDEPGWSLLGTLHGLAQFVRGHLDQSTPRHITVAGEVGYLLGRLDWAAQQPWVDQLTDDVRVLHAQARALTGDQPPRRLGTCTTDGCDGTVFAPELLDRAARCNRCQRSYTGLDLVRVKNREEAS